MEKPFPAYEGNSPYFFVSYAHEDGELVYPEMLWLRDAGFNLWYDDGIHVGTVWRRALADALSRSGGMVFFCTQRAAESENCLQEINFALDEKKPIFVVQMDETPLPAEVRLSLSNRQALRRSEFTQETYRSRLVAALTTVIEPTVKGSTIEAAQKTDPPSIMILPFVSLSDDRELAFLGEGIADTLIASMPISVFQDLDAGDIVRMDLWKKVPGQASDVDSDPIEIGKLRGVRYILHGSLQRGGNRVRATVNLIETAEGQQVWAQRYDRSADNLLEIEDQLVASILDEMGSAVGAAHAQTYVDVRDEELDAWGLVNRAASILVVDRSTRDHVRSLLSRAVDLDPEYGPAHANTAQFLTRMVKGQFTRHPEEFSADALKHADKAIELMPNQPWALSMCSYVHITLGNEAHALRMAERASEILGQDTYALMVALSVTGQAAEVIDRAQRLAHPPYRILYQACVILERNTEALDWAEQSVAEKPREAARWSELANILAILGRTEEALEAVAKARALVPTWTVALFDTGTHLSYRNKDELVDPQLAGLRNLGID